jgi:hypothetical protein
MTTNMRNEVLQLIGKITNYRYPLRWVDEKTTVGDFDGRELAIDVFFIPTDEQINFLSQIRPVRKQISDMTGHPCIFIFHSPDATLTHYSHLFPVTRGIFLVKGEGIKFPLPGPGGTESSPIFSDTEIHFDMKVAA